jgi:hypothetical protein
MNSLKRRNEDMINGFVNADSEKYDLVQLVKDIELRTKTDLRLMESKKFMNRKCRDILRGFNSQIMSTKTDLFSKPLIMAKTFSST